MHKINQPIPKDCTVLLFKSDSNNNIIQLVKIKDKFSVIHNGLQKATKEIDLGTAVKIFAAAQAVPNTSEFTEETVNTFEASAVEILDEALKTETIKVKEPKPTTAAAPKKAAPKKTTAKK